MDGKKPIFYEIITVLLIFMFVSFADVFSQTYLSSPANWIYPEGNTQGTRKIFHKSKQQDIDKFIVKWATDTIAGDVKPLIGNIIANKRLISSFPYAPNEITALIGGKLIVVDATGKTHKVTNLPPFCKDVSVLFDTLSTYISNNVTNAVCLGIETIESENLQDSLSFSYICSYDENSDSVSILKRLAVDLRDFQPNLFGSIRPFFGKNNGTNYQIYATMNMSKPQSNDPFPIYPPFFRGATQFNTKELKSFYPMSDFGDDSASRLTYGPEVNFSQPSMSLVGGSQKVLLPVYPDQDIDVNIPSMNSSQTNTSTPYLISLNMDNPKLQEDIFPIDLSSLISSGDSRPQIRPYYVNITDDDTGDSLFILVTEEYRGIEGSTGVPKLHLYTKEGLPLSVPKDQMFGNPDISPSIEGDRDHLWSIAIGNVDGNSDNYLDSLYLNNRGNEILATESTREFAVPSNKLFVMRYKSGKRVPKKSPPNKYLFPFDTICTYRINGWLAAVNDIDGNPDNKDEIFIADGSRLMILRMYDYQTYAFRDGRYFDTVATFNFPNDSIHNETIQNVAIADLEGDDRNDIIVTTNDRTYLLGRKLYDVLTILNFKSQQIPYEPFCVGDSIDLKWRNINFRSREVLNDDSIFVDLLFRPYLNNIPMDTTIFIARRVFNEFDTITYNYVVDSLVYGMEGRFIVQREDYPTFILDSTAILSFKIPSIYINPLNKYDYFADETLTLSGIAYCLDSVAVEYSYDMQSWTEMNRAEIDSLGEFLISAGLPCPRYYDCILPDIDSILNVIVVSYKGDYYDTSQVISIKVRPEELPINLIPCENSCPSQEFAWDMSSITNPCDSIIISIADLSSNTFSFVDKVPMTDEHYSWNIPTNIPEWIKLRFCCENSCVRFDTVMHDLRPNYIGIVAPNPFKPPYEEANINYSVPQASNVTIRILDQANRLVKGVINNQFRRPGIVYCEKWNGQIWDGSLAANGLYYISLELSSGEKEIFPIYVRK